VRKKWTVPVGIVITLLLIDGLAFLMLPTIPYRLHIGDRITGTFSMTVAGEPYRPADATLGFFDGDKGAQKIKFDGGSSGKFSIKGGEYGKYTIGFILDNEELYKLTRNPKFLSYNCDPTLTFEYVNANWWHVTKLTLTAEMVSLNDTWAIKCKAVYREPTERGAIMEHTAEKYLFYNEVMAGEASLYFGL